jgi:transposase-like protein
MGENNLRKERVKCPDCNSSANVVTLFVGFRCYYCRKRFYKRGHDPGQKTLK